MRRERERLPRIADSRECFLGAFDCGRILTPKTARSQFSGGGIMGLGLALMEETRFDERTGRVMNLSIAEHHMPVTSTCRKST